MIFDIKLLTVLLAVSPALVLGQQAGTTTAEVHPKLQWQKCQKGGHCTDVHGSIVLDAEYRWLHDSHGQNCFTGSWNGAVCPDPKTCAHNCALEGANYQTTYGVETHGNALTQKFISPSHNVGSRLYLLQDEHNYEMFKLLGQEFSFDVDMSKMPCGLNGALYLVSMEKEGGAKHPTNKAGPKYGTGYCDAQCPRGMKFINGEANIGNQHGACCPEMDIWEANSMAAAYTAHPCTNKGFHVCTGSCGQTCESGGCGFNSYAQGDHHFYGPGLKVDTKKKFTVVTQFITNDGTAHGHLTDIRRFYVQDGHVIANSHGGNGNSLSEHFCQSAGSFNSHGGLKGMGEALHDGMVLTFSLWDDHGGNMAWLDANNNGPCPNNGNADQLEKQFPNSAIIYSNIKVGPINSTFHH